MNDLKNEIENLRSTNDYLLFTVAEIQARVATLTSMFLGVSKETLSENEYKSLYTNYVSELTENVNQFLEPLSELVYDNSFLLKQRFELHSAIEYLKRDDSHISKF